MFFLHLSSVDSKSLQVFRYVFNLRGYDHLFTRRNELLSVPLCDYYDFRVLSFFFKLILTKRPGYLLLVISFSISQSGASVLVGGIRLWNQLPLATKNVRSVADFERALMERMRINLT
jgi:hypothetical protein